MLRVHAAATTALPRAQAGDASGTGVFDTAARTWDAAAVDAVDARLKDLLPPLLGPGEVCVPRAR